MLVAVAMWAITQSPFALMFAALGPVVAIASLVDSRIQSRRRGRQEGQRFRAELAIATEHIALEHATELAIREETTPGAPAIVARGGSDPSRWKADVTGPVLVSLGRCTIRSTVEIDGLGSTRGSLGDETDASLGTLVDLAAALAAAPLAIDARLCIGICGPQRLATAAARAIVIQLAWALSPADHWCAASAGAGEWEWLAALPHAAGPAIVGRASVSTIAFGLRTDERHIVSVSVAENQAELSGTHRVVVRVGGEQPAAVLQHPDRELRGEFRPEFVSEKQAAAWAIAATLGAERDGLVEPAHRLPEVVNLVGLLRPAGAAGDGRRSLSCEVVVGAHGAVAIDLVKHGPHAVVGGTTGSGKSELLISWVLAMAAAYAPNLVTFLLVDFKGGSTFAGLARLPHTVGIITDLNEQAASRALASLRAELRYRERVLADAGARSIDELPGELPGGLPGGSAVTSLARLVIVIDELAAMMTDFPELHTLFSDIAARGRSLGVHLILCTQRPAAVVRDAVLANTDLRVSLRVNNRADSVAVVGTDAAASLPASLGGRAIISGAGGETQTVQVAIAEPTDTALVAERWPGPWNPRRPWCDPLPAVIRLAAIDGARGSIAFGMMDLPHEQRQLPAVYDPVEHGHLVILGAQRSGKSTVLATLAEAAGLAGSAGATELVEWIPGDIESAWDAVARANAQITGGTTAKRLLLLDDLDSLLPSFADEHRSAFLEQLCRVLRDGPARGIRLVFSAQRLTAELQSLAALATSRLLLRQSSRQEHLLAGGESGDFGLLPPGVGAGAGIWLGQRVQIALAAAVLAPKPINLATIDPAPTKPLAIVSSRPGELAERMRLLADVAVIELAGAPADPRQLVVASGGRRTILVGDVEEWQSRWGAIAALRATTDILFDGCSVAEFRALTRSRELPPPIARQRSACWLLSSDGSVSRSRLPDA